MRPLVLVLTVFLLYSGQFAKAEMSVMTVAGKVATFNETSVTVIINKKKIRLPRSLIKTEGFKAGDAVLITLRGEEIKFLLSQPDDSALRSPASAPKN
jgi:hypothetical protein